VATLFKSVLPAELLSACRPRIDAAYKEVEPIPGGVPTRLPQNLPPGEKFIPTASSFTIGAILNSDLQTINRAILASPAGEWLRNQLGEQIVCNLDHSWIRRQYAPHRYPRFHAPHAWHQDGALGFDFLSHPDGNYPADALLQMATCWIALDPCGLTAPGLELIVLPTRTANDGMCNKGLLSPRLSSRGGEGETTVARERPLSLLPPSDLTDTRIGARFPSDHFWQPTLEPGDALLFSGDILHRTHVTPAMTHDRTSLELRFFLANDFPARLKNSRLLPLQQDRHAKS
jgi:hypothetical protein